MRTEIHLLNSHNSVHGHYLIPLHLRETSHLQDHGFYQTLPSIMDYNCQPSVPENIVSSAPSSNQSYQQVVKTEPDVSVIMNSYQSSLSSCNTLPQSRYTIYPYNLAQNPSIYNVNQGTQLNLPNSINSTQNFQMQRSPSAVQNYQGLSNDQNSPSARQMNVPNSHGRSPQMNLSSDQTSNNGQITIPIVQLSSQNLQMNLLPPQLSPQNVPLSHQMNGMSARQNSTAAAKPTDGCTTGSEFHDGNSNDSGISSDESRPLTGHAFQQASAVQQANQGGPQYQDFQQHLSSSFYPFNVDWFSNSQLFNKSWSLPWQGMPQMQMQIPTMTSSTTLVSQLPLALPKDKQKGECLSTSELLGTLEDIKDDDLKNRINVELKDKVLWEQFSNLEMEMIITKTGRNLFPKLVFVVSGLELGNRYLFYIRFCRQGDQKFKFVKGEWVEGGKAEEEHSVSQYPHSDNLHFPMGTTWMQGEVGFPKLKLTNNADEKNHSHAVVLRSMHKYVPTLVVHRFDPTTKQFNPFVEKEIKMASFIAVTAYQNCEVTNLKISANPFAKGFREGGRKRSNIDDTPVPAKSANMAINSNLYPGFGYFGNLGMSMPGVGMPAFTNMNMGINPYFGMPYFNGFSAMFNPPQSQNPQQRLH